MGEESIRSQRSLLPNLPPLFSLPLAHHNAYGVLNYYRAYKCITLCVERSLWCVIHLLRVVVYDSVFAGSVNRNRVTTPHLRERTQAAYLEGEVVLHSLYVAP